MELVEERVPVTTAAKLLGISILSLQGALIFNALDLGGAWKNTGSTTYTYYVGLGKLAGFMGISREELRERIKELE